MASACALAIFSGKIIFISRLSRSAERSKRIFTGGVVEGNGIASFSGLALSVISLCSMPALPKGEPLAWRESFRLNRKACGRARSPGGAGAQRLRGYGWRSEKSVKAIAPTGAALAFLCFDFFFRIVKGE